MIEKLSTEAFKGKLTSLIDDLLAANAAALIRNFHDRMKCNIRSAIEWCGESAMRAEHMMESAKRLKEIVEKRELPRIKEALFNLKTTIDGDLLDPSAFAWDRSSSSLSNQRQKAELMARAEARKCIEALLTRISEYEKEAV